MIRRIKKTLFLWLVLQGSFIRPMTAQDLRADSLKIDQLPSIPFLPNPLVIDEGGKNIPVTTLLQWSQKRQWIKSQYQYWISGSVPPPPASFHASVLSELMENGVKIRTVQLRFGPGEEAKMTVELMIPSSAGPLPVFMTQWNHRGWAQVAVRRGYIGCVYAGADAKDDTRNYNRIFPENDFATLMKRAWGCSRVIDYLYTLPEVDTNRIALTGHSRNGKQSLMAAAFDERIKAVVTSSGGTGGESAFRFSDDRFNTESVEEITHNFPNWFSPRLHLFTGREQKLPVDQNSLMSLIAPRGLMLESAITEEQGNPWGIEQSYKSVKEVYHFLHADSNIAILLRRGRHQHAARDIENFIDFFDYIFGRSSIQPDNKLYYNYSFEKWKERSGEHVDPLRFPAATNHSGPHFSNIKSFAVKQDSIREEIEWLLGEEPPGVPANKPFSPFLNRNKTYKDDYLSEVIGQVTFKADAGIKEMRIGPYRPLGDDLWGTIFFPGGSLSHDSVKGKLPLVIYLHGYSYATGYHRRSAPIIQHFLSEGYAVLAFDMIGFGTRIEEALHFYDRYPYWSKMGKMVADTRSIISDAVYRMPFIDSSRIYLAGYSLGGAVALFTAALDKHVKGIAAICAFSSFRNDNKGTEGIRHYYQLHGGLIPRLGFFAGKEQRIPVDFEEVLSCIAPRPLMIIAPKHDRDHTFQSVQNIMSTVEEVYKNMHKSGNLTLDEPNTFNHFTSQMQIKVAEWLSRQKTLSPP